MFYFVLFFGIVGALGIATGMTRRARVSESSNEASTLVRPDQVDETLGGRLLIQLLTPNGRHRRVDNIAFRGSVSVARRVSLDVEVAADDSWDEIGGAALLPLTFIAKSRGPHHEQSMRAFSSYDDHGSPMPILGRSHNAIATWSAIAVAARAASGSEPTAKDLDRIWDIVWRSTDSAEDILTDVLAEYLASQATQSQGGPSDTDSALVKALTNSMFASLLVKVSHDFLLYGVARPCDAPKLYERRVVKFEYEDPFEPAEHSALVLLGLRPATLVYSLGTPLPTPSYHFEVTPPEGVTPLAFVAQLERAVRGETSTNVVQIDDTLDPCTNQDSPRREPSRPHLRLGFVGFEDSVRLGLDVIVARSGEMAIASGLSLFLAALMVAGVWYPNSFLNPNATALSVLLLLPAALGGGIFAARREHILTNYLNRWPRRLLAMSSSLSLIAGVSLVLAARGGHDGELAGTMSSAVFIRTWMVLAAAQASIGYLLLLAGRPRGARFDVFDRMCAEAE